MYEIRQEVMVFILALLAGGIVRLVYRVIVCVRRMIRHTRLAVEIEDLVYWLGVAVYLFVQIYYTSNGSIRWYFVLGVVLGAEIVFALQRRVEKIVEKNVRKRGDKFRQKY